MKIDYIAKKIIDDQTLKIIKSKFNEKQTFFEKHTKEKIKISKCPLCQNSKLFVLDKVYRNFHTYDGVKYLNNIKFNINNESLVLCEKCSLVFTNIDYDYSFYDYYMNLLDDTTDIKNYKRSLLKVDRDFSLEKNKIRKYFINKYFENKVTDFNFNYILNFYKSFFNKKKLLEISFYRGWQISTYKKKYDFYGVEPHTESSNFAIKKFSSFKNKLHNNLFEQSEDFLLKNIYFDILLFSQSFRHMKNPFKAIDLVNKIVSKEGILVIDEGNYVDNLISKFKDEKFKKITTFFLNENKAFYYSTFHLILLFQKYGYEFLENKFQINNKYDVISSDILVFRKVNSIYNKNLFNFKPYQATIETNINFIKSYYKNVKKEFIDNFYLFKIN